MKKKIDYENWDRKEIYELFHGYLFYLTVEIDITEFLETIHKHQWKFYPSICYCITKTVNLDERYRYAKVDGQVCVWAHVNAHYTLMRKNSDHLFTHQRTGYQEDFQKFYEAFLKDKEKRKTAAVCMPISKRRWTTCIFPRCRILFTRVFRTPSRILLQSMERTMSVTFLL